MTGHDSTAAKPGGGPTSERFSVYVVDDEELIGEYVARVVEELGSVDVRVFTDSEAAARAWEESLPDLVITDYQMPGMNGVQLIERFRADPSTASCSRPVTMLKSTRWIRAPALSASR